MAPRTVPLATLLLLTVGLAGCISGNDAVTQEAGDVADLGVGTGIVQGLVVNDEYFPIKGAELTLLLESVQVAMVRTTADGAFVFSGLEPATYELAVLRVGYFAQKLPVPVDAAMAAEVTFTLERVPIADPPFDVTQTIFGNVTIGAAGGSEPAVGMGVDTTDHDFVILGAKEDGTPLAAVYTSIELIPIDSPGAVDMDLYLMGPTGAEVARATTGQPHELIEVPKYLPPGTYTIRVVFWAGAAAQYQLDTLTTFEQGESAEYVVKHQK